jgi:hypothetical protein
MTPIVLFVYNRPDHTHQTIAALQQNELASESELIIYSDAAKNPQAKEKVQEVRDYIKSIDGFKKITIIERDRNWGLANSIIDGVSTIINQYGKVIVLEDDLVTSPYFLKYMNDALEFYQHEPKVMHISGWNYPIDPSGLQDTFLWRVMNCWGWATWADRWQYFEKNPEKLISTWNKEKIKRFDLDMNNAGFWSQVIANHKGKINTWAIFWYASIFEKNGLCLNPTKSLVNNVGHDGSGEHCGSSNNFDVDHQKNQSKIQLTIDFNESTIAVSRVKQFYNDIHVGIFTRLTTRIKRQVKKMVHKYER